jgi:hypothetical protein
MLQALQSCFERFSMGSVATPDGCRASCDLELLAQGLGFGMFPMDLDIMMMLLQPILAR